MSKSSQRWLKEHFSDPYVKKSWEDGYRARAAYKLTELQKKYHFQNSLYWQSLWIIPNIL